MEFTPHSSQYVWLPWLLKPCVSISRIHGGWIRFCLHVTGSGINGWTKQHSTTRPAAGKHAHSATSSKDTGHAAKGHCRPSRTGINTLYEVRSELGTGCREWSASRPDCFAPRRESYRYLLNSGLDGPQSQYVRFGVDKSLSRQRGLAPRTVQAVA
jgi:hypothetical protein